MLLSDEKARERKKKWTKRTQLYLSTYLHILAGKLVTLEIARMRSNHDNYLNCSNWIFLVSIVISDSIHAFTCANQFPRWAIFNCLFSIETAYTYILSNTLKSLPNHLEKSCLTKEKKRVVFILDEEKAGRFDFNLNLITKWQRNMH